MTAWVVVANGDKARLFVSESVHDFDETETLINPYNRLHEGDLTTDKNGLSRGSLAMQSEAYEQPSAKKHEQERFAAQVGERLEQGYNRHQYDTLYLICSPTFLGQLRQQLSPKVCETIKAEIHKNIVTHRIDQIRGQLPKRLQPLT